MSPRRATALVSKMSPFERAVVPPVPESCAIDISRLGEAPAPEWPLRGAGLQPFPLVLDVHPNSAGHGMIFGGLNPTNRQQSDAQLEFSGGVGRRGSHELRSYPVVQHRATKCL